MYIKFENDYQKLGAVGDPIKQTLSPNLHNFLSEKLDLKCIYMPYRVPEGRAKDFLEAAKLLEITGFNVTMPHKFAMAELMDELVGDAKVFNAVNVVKIKPDGKVYGYNTDGSGYMMSIEEQGANVTGKKLDVVGAGGACSSILYNLVTRKPAQIVLLNRSVDKARALADKYDKNIIVDAFTSENLKKYTAECDYFMNTSSLGMVGGDYPDFDFLNVGRKIFVSDVI